MFYIFYKNLAFFNTYKFIFMKKRCLLFMLLAVHFSAFATSYSLSATIDGTQEVPASGSAAIGAMVGNYNDVTNILTYTISYAGLGTVTAMHFHGNAAAGSNTGVKATITVAASPISSNLTVAEADEAAMLAGMWYINIHTAAFGGGEIRGQMAAAPITHILSAVINEAQEVPASGSSATGSMIGTYNTSTNVLSYIISYSGLTPTAMHFHGNAAAGASAGVKATITVVPSPISGTIMVAEADEAAVLGGMWYINIHTSAFPGGEIRGQVAAAIITTYSLSATINAAQEVPTNASTATGSMTGNYDNSTNILSYSIAYTGLTPTSMHFHGNAAAGVNAGVKSTITVAASPVVSNVTVAEADEAAVLAGMWYINIHTSAFGGGEIRGQVAATVLAVDLLTFTASVVDNDVRLDWQTATETNNKGFDVQHSTDNKNWENLAFMASKGSKSAYTFLHQAPSKNTHYYRLAQMDVDGKTTLTKTVAAQLSEKTNLTVFPSLANKNITITGKKGSEYSISDLFGRQILGGYLSDNPTVLDVSALMSGMYLVVTKETSAKFFKS